MKKIKEFALTPTQGEGAYIQYRLRLVGVSMREIANGLGVYHGIVTNVITGQRHSRRVELEIAKTLDYETWNAMINDIRARSAAAAGKALGPTVA